MAKYVYPAIITEEEDGFNVVFPDIPGCYTCGEDLADAIAMAEDALALAMYEKEADKEVIPKKSDIKKMECKENETLSLICCDTLKYRKMYDKAAVKKTLSIPGWLNAMAEEANINFSQLLQEALKAKMHV